MGEESLSEAPDKDFIQRRDAARAKINATDKSDLREEPKREAFFNFVYENADGDAAGVPWADLAPKPPLVEWLANHPGSNKSAIDIACGLGDNAEALAAAGYETTAFDLADTAIDWANKRFPESRVAYQKCDLFDLPKNWVGSFDLVSEIYTIQSVPVEMHAKISTAIASLVAPGGRLFIIAIARDEGTTHQGPPWPLMPSELAIFANLGFELVVEKPYSARRGERIIPHMMAEWRKI